MDLSPITTACVSFNLESTKDKQRYAVIFANGTVVLIPRAISNKRAVTRTQLARKLANMACRRIEGYKKQTRLTLHNYTTYLNRYSTVVSGNKSFDINTVGFGSTLTESQSSAVRNHTRDVNNPVPVIVVTPGADVYDLRYV